MTLQQLRYALAVAQFKSINEASSKLFVTQPTISVSIKELESELNIKIFSRSSHGIDITEEGKEFLGYARTVIDQAQLLKDRYVKDRQNSMVRFTVSSQHYSFSVSAFIKLIERYGMEKYDFCLREARTQDIINDVGSLSANVGVIFQSDFNRAIINRLLKEQDIEFTPIKECMPHVFLSKNCALVEKEILTLEDLKELPFLSFEQGLYSNDYLAEEVIQDQDGMKTIRVSDRATIFNLIRGLNGYTICSGVISGKLDPGIVARPLDSDRKMTIGVITKKNIALNMISEEYIANLRVELEE